MVSTLRVWARECWPAWGVGGMLALLAVFFVAPAIVPLVVPMSRYYELKSITVEDATVGTPSRMIVDRTIHRDFRGRFEIEILRAVGSEFAVMWECGLHTSDWRWYRDEAVLPDDLNLDWWLGIPPNRECRLSPGTYKIMTTIYAQGPLGAVLSTTTESNVFKVHPPYGTRGLAPTGDEEQAAP